MPVLRNPRHEAFAQAIFNGIVGAKGGATSQAEAYRRAGYHVTNGNSARACSVAFSMPKTAAQRSSTVRLRGLLLLRNGMKEGCAAALDSALVGEEPADGPRNPITSASRLLTFAIGIGERIEELQAQAAAQVSFRLRKPASRSTMAATMLSRCGSMLGQNSRRPTRSDRASNWRRSQRAAPRFVSDYLGRKLEWNECGRRCPVGHAAGARGVARREGRNNLPRQRGID